MEFADDFAKYLNRGPREAWTLEDMIEAGGGVPLILREGGDVSNVSEMKEQYVANLKESVKDMKFNYPAYDFTEEDVDTLEFLYHMHGDADVDAGSEDHGQG